MDTDADAIARKRKSHDTSPGPADKRPRTQAPATFPANQKDTLNDAEQATANADRNKRKRKMDVLSLQVPGKRPKLLDRTLVVSVSVIEPISGKDRYGRLKREAAKVGAEMLFEDPVLYYLKIKCPPGVQNPWEHHVTDDFYMETEVLKEYQESRED